ncbi:MAG: carboxypeptidase regulatory-like domain-containing protein [Armatimonadota bacterium]
MTGKFRFSSALLLCLLSLTALQLSALAATHIYYVSPTGNDTTGDGSSTYPWYTLQRANQSATPGTLVLVQPGTYNYSSTNTLSASGTSGSYITYAANGAVTLNFTNSSADGLDITGSHVEIDGFQITGVSNPYTVYISNATDVQVRACNIVPYMMVLNSNDILIRGNVFTQRSGYHGLCIGGSSNYISVYNNTFYGITSGYGVWFNTSGSIGNEVVDCVFKNCWTGIFNTQGLTNTAHDYNMFHGMGSGAFYNLTAQSHEYANTDPLLNNPGSGDYSLRSNSPAKDCGRFVEFAYNGPAPDLGAREAAGDRTITAVTISGVIRDALTSSPIAGATVSGWASSGAITFASTTTDANGYYSLVVPSCVQTMSISKAGYLSQTKGVTVPDSNVNIKMMPGYYVATTGNDTTGDGSESYPWYTLGRAGQSATAGCTVVVKSGNYTYPSTNTLAGSGTSSDRITYRADGNVTINFTNSSTYGFYVTGSNLVIDGFKIVGVSSCPIYVANAGYVDVLNCNITPSSITAWPSCEMLVAGSHDCIIRNNVFGPCTAIHGLWVASSGTVPSSSISILNNTFYGITGGYGILFNTSTTVGNQVLNCIFKNCHIGIYNSQGLADANHNHNMFHGMNSSALYNLTQQTGEFLNTDPLLTNPGSGDYSLASNSPAIDCGYDYGLWFGERAPDYGAFETNPFMVRTASWWNPAESFDVFDTAKWADDVYSMKTAGLNGAWFPCFPYIVRCAYDNVPGWGVLPKGDWVTSELAKFTTNVAYSDSVGQKTIIGLPYHTSNYPEDWLLASNFAYMLEFVDRIAKETAPYHRVAYAFCGESVNAYWYQTAASYPVLVNHFRDWCWNQNTNISYWNTRWGTSYTWDTILPSTYFGAGNGGIDYLRWMFTGVLRPLLVEVGDHIKAYAPNAPLGYHDWLWDSRVASPTYAPIPAVSKYDFCSANLYGGTAASQSKITIAQSLYAGYPLFACELGTGATEEPASMKAWLEARNIGYNWWCWYTGPGEPSFGLVDVEGRRKTDVFPLLPNYANYGTIRGKVTCSGNPVYYATVKGKIGTSVYGTVRSQYRAQSFNVVYTFAGVYRLDLSPGTYTVEISKAGYQTQTINNVVVTAGQDTNLDIVLSVQPNMIANPGFDTNLTGWTKQTISGGGLALESYDDVSHPAWRLIDAYDGQGYLVMGASPSPGEAIVYQDVSVSPNTTYILSWWEKLVGTKFDGWSPTSADQWLNVSVDQKQGTIWGGPITNLQRMQEQTSDWRYTEAVFRTGSATTKVRVKFDAKFASGQNFTGTSSSPRVGIDSVLMYQSTEQLTEASSISDAKNQPDGTLVAVTGVGTSCFPNASPACGYIESADRTGEMNVYTTNTSLGNPMATVRVVGHISTNAVTDEKEITDEYGIQNIATGSVKPVGIINRSIGMGYGLSTMGLLVKTFGSVISIAADMKSFAIDDGSRTPVTVTDFGYDVPSWMQVGSFVELTGISSLVNDGGGTIRCLRVPQWNYDTFVPWRP